MLAVGMSPTLNAQELKVKTEAYTDLGSTRGIELSVENVSAHCMNEGIIRANHRKADLAPGGMYLLTFSKEGYVSKSILIEAPDDMKRDRTVRFDVMLGPQLDGDMRIEFDTEIAYIYFRGGGNMEYETDYSYSVIASNSISDQ